MQGNTTTGEEEEEDPPGGHSPKSKLNEENIIATDNGQEEEPSNNPDPRNQVCLTVLALDGSCYIVVGHVQVASVQWAQLSSDAWIISG